MVHKLPPDLRKALIANTTALAAWKDITPLARNEFICWVEDAKQEMTRESRILLVALCRPCKGAVGEGDHLVVRVPDERGSGVTAVAGEDMQHAIRQAGLLKHPRDQETAGNGRPHVRLQHHRVATCERGNRVRSLPRTGPVLPGGQGPLPARRRDDRLRELAELLTI